MVLRISAKTDHEDFADKSLVDLVQIRDVYPALQLISF